MSIHANPEKHGVTFGRAVVTVDREAGDCMIRAPQPGKGPAGTIPRSARFNSIEAIQEALVIQQGLASRPAQNPHAPDVVNALKHALRELTSQSKDKRYG